ncbi:MAG TPA: hypothetical protein VLL52_16190 [Anaerolineae bacterium]|nr:hypothetical protein [Anaerolineae bacterium]
MDWTKRLWGGLLVADVVTLVVGGIWGRGMVGVLGETGRGYVVGGIVIYLLFCVGVYGLRKLDVKDGERGWGYSWWVSEATKSWRAVVGVWIAVLFVVALLHQVGYLASLPIVDARTLGEGEAVAYFVMAPGAWLALALIFALVTGSQFEMTVGRDWRWYGLVVGLGVVVVNGMALLLGWELAAVWQLVSGEGWGVVGGVVGGLLLLVGFMPLRWLLLGLGRAEGRVEVGLMMSFGIALIGLCVVLI